MENKINIAKLLKDCPKGMELDCTMIDNVVFEKLDFISSHHPIIIRRTDSNKTIHLTKYGQYSDEEDYKCVIFPKGKATWDGFVPPCKFKVGDRIRLKNGGSIIEVTSINNDSSICVNGMSWTIKIEQQDNYELVPNKFDINTLVPFESKVLVRAVDNQFWRPAIWGVKHLDWDYYCVLGGEMWEQCIPYEGNEHLLGTNNDCDKYFKTWES